MYQPYGSRVPAYIPPGNTWPQPMVREYGHVDQRSPDRSGHPYGRVSSRGDDRRSDNSHVRPGGAVPWSSNDGGYLERRDVITREDTQRRYSDRPQEYSDRLTSDRLTSPQSSRYGESGVGAVAARYSDAFGPVSSRQVEPAGAGAIRHGEGHGSSLGRLGEPVGVGPVSAFADQYSNIGSRHLMTSQGLQPVTPVSGILQQSFSYGEMNQEAVRMVQRRDDPSAYKVNVTFRQPEMTTSAAVQEDWRKCQLCDKDFDSPKYYQLHCTGVLHLQKVQQQAQHHAQQQRKLQQLAAQPVPEPVPPPPKLERKSVYGDGKKHHTHCKICDVFNLNSASSFANHIGSREHQRRFLSMQSRLGYEEFKKRYLEVPFNNYDVTESSATNDQDRFISRSGIANELYCRICDAKCVDSVNWKEHLLGKRHFGHFAELHLKDKEKIFIDFGDLFFNDEVRLQKAVSQLRLTEDLQRSGEELSIGQKIPVVRSVPAVIPVGKLDVKPSMNSQELHVQLQRQLLGTQLVVPQSMRGEVKRENEFRRVEAGSRRPEVYSKTQYEDLLQSHLRPRSRSPLRRDLDSGRRASPARQISPEQHARRDTRFRSPERDVRRRSPPHEVRHRSPEHNVRRRSPQREASRSPRQTAASRHETRWSPPRRSPPRGTRREASPRRETRRQASPRMASPRRDQRRASPRREQRQASPRRDSSHHATSRSDRPAGNQATQRSDRPISNQATQRSDRPISNQATPRSDRPSSRQASTTRPERPSSRVTPRQERSPPSTRGSRMDVQGYTETKALTGDSLDRRETSHQIDADFQQWLDDRVKDRQQSQLRQPRAPAQDTRGLGQPRASAQDTRGLGQGRFDEDQRTEVRRVETPHSTRKFDDEATAFYPVQAENLYGSRPIEERLGPEPYVRSLPRDDLRNVIEQSRTDDLRSRLSRQPVSADVDARQLLVQVAVVDEDVDYRKVILPTEEDQDLRQHLRRQREQEQATPPSRSRGFSPQRGSNSKRLRESTQGDRNSGEGDQSSDSLGKAVDLFSTTLQQFLQMVYGEREQVRRETAVDPLEGFSSDERAMVYQVQQMTGISDLKVAATAMKVLGQMDPILIQIIGSLNPDTISEILRGNPNMLKSLPNYTDIVAAVSSGRLDHRSMQDAMAMHSADRPARYQENKYSRFY